MKSMDKLTTGIAYSTSAGSAGYWFLQLLDKKANLRDIFFCLATEEQKIGLLRLNIAEKKHGRE